MRNYRFEAFYVEFRCDDNMGNKLRSRAFKIGGK